MYEEQRQKAAQQFQAVKAPKGAQQVELVLNTQGLPYDHEVKKRPYGIQAVNYECPYPIKVSDQEIQSSECKEGQYESSGYAVRYPKTEEEELKEYYDDVLKRHEEACLKAAEYKKHIECLPGTVIKEKDDDHQLSKSILVGDIQLPSKEKFNPCLIKKQVRFLDPPDRCLQRKDDTCNLKVITDHCQCTDFNK